MKKTFTLNVHMDWLRIDLYNVWNICGVDLCVLWKNQFHCWNCVTAAWTSNCLFLAVRMKDENEEREREKKECLYNFDLKIMSLSNRKIEWKLEFRCNASGLKCHYDFKMDSRMPKPHCAQSFTVPSGCCKISGMNVFLHSWMNWGLVKLLYSSF